MCEETMYLIRFDEDGQNMDEFFEDKDEAIKYAEDNLDCGPVMYEIDEDGNENVYRYFEEENNNE